MPIIINHDVRVVDGATIYMPAWFQGEVGWGNLQRPNIYLADGDATAKYPVGTKFVEGDRAFRYIKYVGTGAGWNTSTVTATDGDDLFGKFLFVGTYQQDYATGLVIRHVSGETSSWIGTTVSTDRSDDFYSGGILNGKDTAPSDARHFGRRVVAHNYTAVGTEDMFVGGSSFTLVSELQLDQPIVNSKTSMAVTVMPVAWKHGIWMPDTASAAFGPALGASMVNDPVATRFIWVQVSGPMPMHHVTNAAEGANSDEMLFYIMGDGSCQAIQSGDTYTQIGYHQVAGRIWSNTSIESGLSK